MRTALRMGLVVLVTLTLGLWGTMGRSPAAPALASARQIETTPASQLVQVEHQLVRTSAAIVEPKVVKRQSNAGTTRTARAVEHQPPVAQPVFLSRARRAFFGDGRHRPEPFPRAAQ